MFKEFFNKRIARNISKLYYKKYHFTVCFKDGKELAVTTENLTLNDFNDVLKKINQDTFIRIEGVFYSTFEIERIELKKIDKVVWYDGEGLFNLPPITVTLERLNENNKKYEKYIKYMED